MTAVIEQVLAGDLEMDTFLQKLENDEKLQTYIYNFVPKEAKNDPNHNFWRVVPYKTMRENDFNYYKFLFWGLSNNKYGNQLNIFSKLQRAYLYYYPGFVCTSRYDDVFDLYLDAIQDCFDGPEVQHVIECIIDDALQFRFKGQRKKYAQTAIKECFLLESKKRPRWVHGPEWPMGINSPMTFVSQKKVGDKVQFIFRDSDTEEFRVIEQFY